MRFYAHSGREENRSDWQLLEDHLQDTAELAGRLGADLGLEAAARIAGLFHDLGKFDPSFDRRLMGENFRFDHSTAGGVVLTEAAQGREVLAAEAISYAILGHHAGLPDKTSASDASMTRRLAAFSGRLDPVWRAHLSIKLEPAVAELLSKVRPSGCADFDLSLAVRMIFSCLVEADFRDTEAFYAQLDGRRVDRDWSTLGSRLPDLLAAFDAKIASFPTDTVLNRRRAEILTYVRARAGRRPGLFTLTVPTGGGKTLASLGFALDHAAAHGLRRIIYAIPYTSIIDQTATAFRGVFRAVDAEDLVLEHHASIDDRIAGDREGREKLKLAMENWAAPVVVTTTVQLFESLFAARSSRARKLHNIAGSVIVLDEAQSLPRQLVLPSLRMLDALARHYGCSIVLCTATQPAFDSEHLKDGGLDLAGRELAPDPSGLAGTFRRVTLERVGEMDDLALVAALGGVEQGLVIVNSRKHALTLYQACKAAGLKGLIHLTTRQYAAHRQRVLDDIRARLGEGRPCRAIATSLVEAGVDLDFPRVWRAEAGLDSIVQAAGRCNREGRRPIGESIVTVFGAPENEPPAEVRALVDAMRSTAGHYDDLLGIEAIRDWFDQVYWRAGAARLDGKQILKEFKVTKNGKTDFAFREVAARFRMIEDQMQPVIVALEPEAETVVRELGVEAIRSGMLARRLQRYTVGVPARARDRLIAAGHAAFEHAELRGDQFCVLSKASLYTEDSGLHWEDADYLAMEDWVV